MSTPALAVFKINPDNPSNFSEVTGELDRIRNDLNQAMCGGWDFEINVEGVFNEGSTPEGKIALVENLPGRNGDPLANPESGMASRDGNYDFPSTTAGFQSVCRPYTAEYWYQEQRPWRTNPNFYCEHPCQRPLGNITPGNAGGNFAACGSQQANDDGVMYSCGGGQMKPPGEGIAQEILANGQSGGLCGDLNKWAYTLYKLYLGGCDKNPLPEVVDMVEFTAYMKGPCQNAGGITTDPIPNDPGGDPDLPQCQNDADCPQGPQPSCVFDGENLRCSNAAQLCNTAADCPLPPVGRCINNTCRNYNDCSQGAACPSGQSCIGGACRPAWTTGGELYECCTDSPIASQDNCIPCQGNSCRLETQKSVQAILNEIWIEASDGGTGVPGCFEIPPEYQKRRVERFYKSFFREYPVASFERDAITEHVQQDSAKREEIPVACYGIYETNTPPPPTTQLTNPSGIPTEDAKVRKIEDKEKRCVIAAYYNQKDANFWGMKESQKGKADYGQNNSTTDPYPTPNRQQDFNEQKDIWYSKLGGGFSMLNDSVYRKYFGDDLTFALLSTDAVPVKQMASGQLPTGSGTVLSSGALLRAFDDTVAQEDGDRRTIVEWWQGLETEMHKRLSPPIVRVLLPSPWSLDLNPLDPLFTPPVEDPNAPPEDIKLQGIEVQLHADEDLVGEVAAYMERSLILNIQEEPIRVVVPLASATELHALAHGWQNWATVKYGDSPPDDVTQFIRKLNEYAERADRVRALRAELPRYISTLLNRQTQMSEKIAEWLVKNVDLYQQYLDQREQIDQLTKTWKEVQGVYREFHDITALPWCRNDRFTTPIYSLLDPWMTHREENGDLKGNLPYRNCVKGGEENQVCEASHGKGLPELSVLLQPNIEMDLTAFANGTGAVKIPVLDPVQIRLNFETLQPPAIGDDREVQVPELAELPPFTTEPAFYEQVRRIFPNVTVVDPPKTITTPQLNPEQVENTLAETKKIVEKMAEEYKLFWESAVNRPKPGTEQDCLNPHDKNCVHFEMDLRERLQRFAARPAIFLVEDYLSLGERIDRTETPYEKCPTEDWVCQLLHRTEKNPREGWQVEIRQNQSSVGNVLDELRDNVREATDGIPEDQSNSSQRFPYDIDQKDILPTFRNPPQIDLTPPFSASSRSSS